MKSRIRIKGNLRLYLQLPLFLTAILVLLNIPAYMVDCRLGVSATIFTVIYLICELLLYLGAKPKLAGEVISFATRYATVQKHLLNEFEIPYALLDYNGKLLWTNEEFRKLTGIDRNYHKSITSLFASITREVLQKPEFPENFYVDTETRHFRVSANHIYFDSMTAESKVLEIENSEEFLIAIYLFDETKLQHYMKENADQKLVSAIVYIDNYDETMNSIESVKQSFLTALVDRRVTQYFSKVDGIVRKVERDKYFVIFRHKFVEDLEEDKFKVLEDVKAIKIGNELPITLSIGVGLSGDSYSDTYEAARAAIDLALGRGGDQAVLKRDSEITYYGGKAKEVERNTRVKARVKAHALREILESRDNVIIMGHSLTDIDSLGAGIGVYCAAKFLGKKAQIVINNPTSSVRPLLETFKPEDGYAPDMFIDSEQALEELHSNTAVMVVDTNRPSYTECPELLKRANTIVVFDHHRQNSEVIENPTLSYIEPYASSACEMVAEVLQYFDENLKIEPVEADCIYSGILIDTNNFMQKTGVRTFEAAAYLKRCGVDVSRVRKKMRNDMDSYKARAAAVRNSEVYRDAFAISICPGEGIESPTIVGAQAANELLNINGIKASFVLTEFNDKVFVSSRSIDEINVQIIMEKLGGGGHMNVAGAQLEGYTIDQAKGVIMKTLDDMIEKGDIEI